MTRSRVPVGETDGRLCAALNCRKPLVRHANEGHHHYNRRLCCSRECAFRHNSEKHGFVEIGDDDGRECRHCGKPLTRHVGEAMTEYRKRRHCDNECGRKRRGIAIAAHFAEHGASPHPGPRIEEGQWPAMPPWAFADNVTESGERRFVRLVRPDATHVSNCGSSALMAAQHWGAKW